jgi:predicted DsbA family dithiol-disulfide isomerase
VESVEVFAEVVCPFAHVGLRRVVARRAELGLSEPVLRVRAWPLELVNGRSFDAQEIARHVGELRDQVAPDLFGGFAPGAVPTTSLPALALAAAAYQGGLILGERVSLALRRALFEESLDVSDPLVLDRIACEHGVSPPSASAWSEIAADLAEGRRRGVRGSPEFIVGDRNWFCPALQIDRRGDQIVVIPDATRFDAFLDACFMEVVR